MKVLSLFDGMACGMIAMQLAGVDVESYDAYEIDKYAIKTAQHNFPMIKEHGDVFVADFTQYEGVDFLIGGSPCTYWSIAQTKNRETVASGMGWELFSQYVRALHEAKPKYFIYENNKSMSKAIRASIDETFGFEAVLINSALVSAQNRQRLYWVGKRNDDGTYSKVLVDQPEDRWILLRDILETGIAWHEKSYCITATEYKGSNPQQTLTKHRRTMVAEPVNITKDGKAQCLRATYCKDGIRNMVGNTVDRKTCVAEPIEQRCVAQRGRYPENPKSRVAGLPTEQMFEARQDGKTNTLTTVQKYNLVAEPVRIGTYPTSDGRLLNSQGNRIYSVDGNALTQSAQWGGLGAKTGLYAVPVGTAVDAEKNTVAKSIDDIVSKKGYLPEMFNPYNRAEITTKSPTLSTGSMVTSSCAVLMVETADGKQTPIYKVHGGLITIKGKQYPIKLQDGYYIIRKLTVRECMRLQTVPEWYEFPVSDSQSYKMLGNGWTCEVIAHILKYLKEA